VKRIINLGLIQMSCSEDLQKNFDKAVNFIEQAAQQGANIVCTQELFKSRYFPQVMDRKNFDLAEEIHGDTETMKRLTALAGDLQIVLIASLFEKRVSGLYHNTTVVIDADGSFLGKYRKMHIPEDPGYIEKFYFTPGDLGYKVFKTRYADIGVLICWDQWFPEAARLIALKGGEIIIYPTAIGYSPPEKAADGSSNSRETWQIVQQGHAAANACFVATINRVGLELTPGIGPGIKFWGGSFIANPGGQVIAQASESEDEVLVKSIDLDIIDNLRSRESYPFRDRRVDSYQDLTKLYSD
jgi:N-carbamoylputrescine amidase